MAEAPSENGPGPVLRLSLEAVEPSPTALAGLWRTTWRLRNPMPAAVAVLEAWLPHDQFHAERQKFQPALALSASAEILLTLDVHFSGRNGEVIENAFLILRARYDGELWLVFARLRVENDQSGLPMPIIESLTSNRAGMRAPAG